MKKLIAIAIAATSMFSHADEGTADKHYCADNKLLPIVEVDKKLCHQQYAAGYSYKYKAPIWSAYKVSIYSTVNPGVRKTEYRVQNADIPFDVRVLNKHFDNSQYIKSRMVPAEVLRASKDSQNSGNLLTNAIPQLPKFNRYQHNSHGSWGALLELEKEWGIPRNEVHVFTGPIYGKTPELVNGKLPVPNAFYKIIYDDKLKASISFLIPHIENSARQLMNHRTSVDCIEELTGIDFLNHLDIALENDIENAVASGFEMWAMQDGKHLPSTCTEAEREFIK